MTFSIYTLQKILVRYIPRLSQVNQALIEVYMSINQSVLATIQRAEVMIDVAQEKNTTPFIDSALEQLKKATTELNTAMKRVRGRYFNPISEGGG